MVNSYDEYINSENQEVKKVYEEDARLKKYRLNKENDQINIMGIKLSYSKGFGIVFMIIFLLLFFPGIGVSSSSVKSKGKTVADAKGNS
ncbi:MAG: hypothetical protein PHI90_01430 [Clostridia bacterium]|nr:hypothetical protein [Clostridia bacterium]MDD4047487.1 hypothetical protein [Clostridia bacterium]